MAVMRGDRLSHQNWKFTERLEGDTFLIKYTHTREMILVKYIKVEN